MPLDKLDRKFTISSERIIHFNKLQKDAKIPSYSKIGDAGMDLSSIEEVSIPASEKLIIKTGIRVVIPKGTVGLICPRSGLASRYGITVVNSPGILDQGYRGEIMVALINHSKCNYVVKKGDRIAQLVITPFINCEILETEDFYEDTERGTGGFGSSGI